MRNKDGFKDQIRYSLKSSLAVCSTFALIFAFVNCLLPVFPLGIEDAAYELRREIATAAELRVISDGRAYRVTNRNSINSLAVPSLWPEESKLIDNGPMSPVPHAEHIVVLVLQPDEERTSFSFYDRWLLYKGLTSTAQHDDLYEKLRRVLAKEARYGNSWEYMCREELHDFLLLNETVTTQKIR